MKALIHDHRVSCQDSLEPKVIVRERAELVRKEQRAEERRGIHSPFHSLLHSVSNYCLLGAGATNMLMT